MFETINEMKLEKKEYLENPIEASALLLRKTCNFKAPAYIKVLNENKFNPSLLETHIDEAYFKLVHYLEDIDKQFNYDELFKPHMRRWADEATKTAVWEVYKFIHVNTVAPFKTFRTKIRKWKKLCL